MWSIGESRGRSLVQPDPAETAPALALREDAAAPGALCVVPHALHGSAADRTVRRAGGAQTLPYARNLLLEREPVIARQAAARPWFREGLK